jgi:CHAD domain-containing protein
LPQELLCGRTAGRISFNLHFLRFPSNFRSLGVRMPFDQERSQRTFAKLDRQLAKLSDEAAPERVHGFRTYSRRVETLLKELKPEPSGNTKKVLKALGQLRGKAGRVRDLDVQTALLRGLKLPQAAAQKSQLMRGLAEDRAKRAKKLAKALDEKAVGELRKRLRRVARDLEVPENFDALERGLRQLRQLGKIQESIEEGLLHRYRIAGKRARYLAELAGKSAEAERVVAELKRMQDLIGDWHDWLKLTEKAEKLFGGVRESTLVAALHNVTRAKFQQSAKALEEMRASLLGKASASQAVHAASRRQQVVSAA